MARPSKWLNQQTDTKNVQPEMKPMSLTLTRRRVLSTYSPGACPLRRTFGGSWPAPAGSSATRRLCSRTLASSSAAWGKQMYLWVTETHGRARTDIQCSANCICQSKHYKPSTFWPLPRHLQTQTGRQRMMVQDPVT